MGKSNIEIEFHQIEVEMDIVQLLNDVRRQRGLDSIQIRAAASSLHAIYNGIERIFLTILKEKEIRISQTGRWHSELFERIAKEKLLPDNLLENIKEYMAFRHFFRHSYGFMIDEELITPLMANVTRIVAELRTRLLEK